MFLSSPILSPLAEKRIILFTVKKQMIGRRAYSDSIFKKTRHTIVGQNEEQNSSHSSASSSPRNITPTQAEIDHKSAYVDAC
jgi:hypothetical protein